MPTSLLTNYFEFDKLDFITQTFLRELDARRNNE